MKKHCCLPLLLFVGILFVGATASLAQNATEHPAPDVDGKVWMDSTHQEKTSFLFGAGSAVVLEYHIRATHSQEPSRFVKGWVDVLKDTSWEELAHKIDTYYKNNPDKMHRHVFEVIWHEIIAPNWKNQG